MLLPSLYLVIREGGYLCDSSWPRASFLPTFPLLSTEPSWTFRQSRAVFSPSPNGRPLRSSKHTPLGWQGTLFCAGCPQRPVFQNFLSLQHSYRGKVCTAFESQNSRTVSKCRLCLCSFRQYFCWKHYLNCYKNTYSGVELSVEADVYPFLF